MNRHVLLVTLTATAACAHLGIAQEPTSAEILTSIQTSGSIDRVVEQLTLNGCPQQDDVGRQRFELLSGGSWPPQVLAELSILWRHALAECDNGPMQNWSLRALEQLVAADDRSATETFVMSLPPDITPQMRDLLWREVESGVGPGVYEAVLANAAVRGGEPSLWLTRTLDAFRRRRTSSEWVQGETAAFLREEPALFLRGLAQASASIPDNRLAPALAIVGGVTSREADINDGLRSVRESVRSRQGIPAALRSVGAAN